MDIKAVLLKIDGLLDELAEKDCVTWTEDHWPEQLDEIANIVNDALEEL